MQDDIIWICVSDWSKHPSFRVFTFRCRGLCFCTKVSESKPNKMLVHPPPCRKTSSNFLFWKKTEGFEACRSASFFPFILSLPFFLCPLGPVLWFPVLPCPPLCWLSPRAAACSCPFPPRCISACACWLGLKSDRFQLLTLLYKLSIAAPHALAALSVIDLQTIPWKVTWPAGKCRWTELVTLLFCVWMNDDFPLEKRQWAYVVLMKTLTLHLTVLRWLVAKVSLDYFFS